MSITARSVGIVLAVTILANPTTGPIAQGTDASPSPVPIVLQPVTESGFGVSSVVPEGWSPIGPGVHGRRTTPTDPTLLGIQSAATTRERLWPSLLPQLGLTDRPMPAGTRATDAGLAWTLYEVPIAARQIVADLALAEADGHTYLVLLVSGAGEEEALRTGVFLPAVDAFRVLGPAASPATSPGPIAYQQVDVTFPGGAADVVLAGTLSVPDGPGPFPAIALLSGSGPQDRDESLAPIAAIKPFALIADALARAGIAVLRFDDRGTAHSTGDFGSATVDDFTLDGAAAVAYLRGRPEVDPSRVGVLGHSEGGIEVATLGARDPAIAFIVGMAAPAVDGVEVLVAQNEAIARTSGLNDEEVAEVGQYARDVYAAALAGDMDQVEAIMRGYFGRLYDRQAADGTLTLGPRSDFIDESVAGQLPVITSKSFLSLLRASPGKDWRQVHAPVLALYGGKDVQVPAAQEVEALRSALAAAGNTDVTISTLPDANHLFQSAKTGAVGEYGSLEQVFTPDFLPTLVDWVTGHAGVAP